MNVDAMVHYLAAHDAIGIGDPQVACKSLAQSLGVGICPDILQENIDLAMNPTSFLGQGILQLVIHEAAAPKRSNCA